MATQTTNLGLTKPGYDEAADVVPAVNNNMDTLDSKIGAVPANSSVQGQLDSHTQAIGNLSNLTTTEKGSLVGAANELNSKIQNMFENRNYSKEGITFTDCTYVDGGYVDFGDFVLFNIRVTITVASSTTKQYMTLPNSIKSRSSIAALTAMNVTTDDAPIYAISTSGAAIHLKDTLANKAYSIFGMWLK